MINELWETKVLAFLWNPPFRALVDETKVEEWRKQIKNKIDASGTMISKVKQAEHLAISCDVLPFASKVKVDFLSQPILKHPLFFIEENSAANEHRLWDNEHKPSPHKLEVAVDEVISRFFNACNEPKKLFLTLWRLLSGYGNKSGLGFPGEMLPAYSAMPHHSIWEHQSIISALSSALPSPSLLIFTIASADEFITTARRTQDAWLGSFLLSYLTWQAIREIANKYGPDCFIYPTLKGQPLVDLWLKKEIGIDEITLPSPEQISIASFPNIFTAIVPEDQAEILAREARAAMEKELEDIAKKVKEKVETAYQKQLGENDYWNQTWKRHIDDFFDRLGVFWVVCPWDWRPDKPDNIGKIEALVTEYKALFNTKESESFIEWEKLYHFIKKDSAEANISLAYPLISRLAGRLMPARKNLRNFYQRKEPGYKCTLCGIREVIHPNKKGEYERLRDFWKTLSETKIWVRGERIKLKGRIRRGERLCAICTVKRLALEAYFEKELGIDYHLFPSTASIATASFKFAILDTLDKTLSSSSLKELLSKYVKEVTQFLEKYEIFYQSAVIPRLKQFSISRDLQNFLYLDGDWLYGEAFDRDRIQREYGVEVKEEELTGVRSALTNFLNTAKQQGIGMPPKYYAIVYLDGDRIGDWLSGELAPKLKGLLHPVALNDNGVGKALDELGDIKRPLGILLHTALSSTLRNFALEIVGEVVEKEHCGKLVYAGGDDLLAFLPVEDLAEVSKELRYLFSGESIEGSKIKGLGNGFAQIDDKLLCLMGKEASCSAGIIIAHHSYPLSLALEEAREALEQAKKEMGRDAFALKLLKRSGEALQVKAKWRYDDLDIWDTISKIAKLMKDQVLSPRLAYDMKLEAETFFREPVVEALDAQEKEFSRLLDRHIKSKQDKDFVAELGKFLEKVRQWWFKEEKPKPEELWNQLTGLLLLSHFISGEE